MSVYVTEPPDFTATFNSTAPKERYDTPTFVVVTTQRTGNHKLPQKINRKINSQRKNPITAASE
jgi:hypothetical protein